jgi:Domain of unknown function (DUF4307)
VPTSTDPVFPAGRYGRRRDPRGRRRQQAFTVVAALLVTVVGVLIAVKLFRQYALPPYEVSNVVVSDVTDTSVTVSFDLARPEGASACTVVALARNGARLATVEVPVPAPPAGQSSTHVRYTVRTTVRPYTANVPGCGPPG